MRQLMAVIAALALGAISVVYIHSYVRRREIELLGASIPVTVAFAAEDLKAGSELLEPMVELGQIPDKYCLPEMVRQEGQNRLALFWGKKVDRDVKQGMPLLADYFVLESEHLSLGPRISGKKRAVTVAVDKVTGLSGLLEPGSYVDVLATFEVAFKELYGQAVRSAETVPQTYTLLARKPVLAVDRRLSPLDPMEEETGSLGESYASVTLEVTPEEAQILTFAQIKGRVSLVLRNRDDMDDGRPPLPATLEGILREAAKLRSSAPPASAPETAARASR